MRLGEVNVICRDLEKAKAFYCGLLGVEALEMEGPNALHCKVENARILLLAVAEHEADQRAYETRACMSFDLMTEDLAGLCERLKEAGVRFETEYNGRSAFVRDPDGNVVELLQA